MNTTTTETAAETGKSTAKPRSATSAKRRMAREATTVAAPDGSATPQDTATPARTTSKIATVIALLKRTYGATLAEMVVATGWLPHTTRAALTGLKKKGHTITKGKRGDVTCYFVTSPEA